MTDEDNVVVVEESYCMVNCWAQNPVLTRSINILGPPMDILRKVTDVSKASESEKIKVARKARIEFSTQSRRRRWWVILLDLKLYFYESYGDSKPKLIADIFDVTISLIKEKDQSLRILLVHPDQHRWALDFQLEEESIKFYFSLTESRKCLEDSSIYMRTADMVSGRNRQYGLSHLGLF